VRCSVRPRAARDDFLTASQSVGGLAPHRHAGSGGPFPPAPGAAEAGRGEVAAGAFIVRIGFAGRSDAELALVRFEQHLRGVHRFSPARGSGSDAPKWQPLYPGDMLAAMQLVG
jgi:hypothetical protein